MLTLEQKQTIKAFVLADPALSALVAGEVKDYSGLAAALNASSTFVVWRTRVSEAEMHASYVWTEMDSLTQPRFNSLTLLLKPGFVNPAIPNVRQGLNDIFTGAQLVATRTALLALAKRAATVAERLFATGTGTTATPGLLVWEGKLVPQEMAEILAS